jgi:hypothetical protein
MNETKVGATTLVREVQFEKTQLVALTAHASPILLETDVGISIQKREEQPANAIVSIDISEVGRRMLTSELHPKNA